MCMMKWPLAWSIEPFSPLILVYFSGSFFSLHTFLNKRWPLANISQGLRKTKVFKSFGSRGKNLTYSKLLRDVQNPIIFGLKLTLLPKCWFCTSSTSPKNLFCKFVVMKGKLSAGFISICFKTYNLQKEKVSFVRFN